MKILDLNIVPFTYDEILKIIHNSISKRSHLSISYVNVFIALKARREKAFRDLLDGFSLLHADGIGIYLASRFLWKNKGLPQRITGTDLYYQILQLAETKGYGIFFWGGGTTASEALRKKLKQEFPSLKVTGSLSCEIKFKDEVLEQLNHSESEILFLGLGTPSQEKWIATHGKKCNISTKICVGSGIDFLAGTYPRAPMLFRKVGFEWLYRMFIEPKRLWKRYLIGNPIFIYSIVKQKLFSIKD